MTSKAIFSVSSSADVPPSTLQLRVFSSCVPSRTTICPLPLSIKLTLKVEEEEISALDFMGSAFLRSIVTKLNEVANSLAFGSFDEAHIANEKVMTIFHPILGASHLLLPHEISAPAQTLDDLSFQFHFLSDRSASDESEWTRESILSHLLDSPLHPSVVPLIKQVTESLFSHLSRKIPLVFNPRFVDRLTKDRERHDDLAKSIHSILSASDNLAISAAREAVNLRIENFLRSSPTVSSSGVEESDTHDNVKDLVSIILLAARNTLPIDKLKLSIKSELRRQSRGEELGIEEHEEDEVLDEENPEDEFEELEDEEDVASSQRTHLRDSQNSQMSSSDVGEMILYGDEEEQVMMDTM